VSRRTLYTVILLAFMIVGITVLLFREAASGPAFRAADYNSLAECMANIPAEWVRGGLEYMGAEAACHYRHRGAPPPRGG
jgi:hypothetical protein